MASVGIVKEEQRLSAALDAAAIRAGIALDPAQLLLVDRLAILSADIERRTLRRSTTQSLYIHGPAGRGKSWLADAFFVALPTARKTRVHFHRFFDDLHRSIQDHRSERDAVERAIDDLTGNSQLLFFDELHVHDSGDARLLTRLLEHVFRRKLTVLATSNYAPDDLLPDPIWHHIFEPGIDLIKNNMEVYELGGATDYRTTHEDHSTGFAAGVWARESPTPEPRPEEATNLAVRGRQFPVLAARPGELRATFAQLCGSPTSTIEYLAWARSFPRWVINDVPNFDDADAEAQQRFINLIDILVDADVCATFVSSHSLSSFLSIASRRPDAFRMASRLQLLRDSDDL
ncbi:cell division protein ZapE [Mycetocola zhujimingii]|uniref:cell division protein ZapE n=1 Tax=Mycetocola zhujimingii TaxID=2079792 RepID=UPI001E3B6AE5|nr:cell division protein ZapE [Mycetocola zhujimingii]